MPIKFYIYGAIGIFLLTAVGGTYLYVKHLQSENAILIENNAKLEQSVNIQKDTITSLEQDSQKIRKQSNIVNKKFSDARNENSVLRNKLGKHDLAYLAEKKPGLIKKIVNKGTKNVGRCFEILSGADLTEKEKTGEVNSKCTGITKVAP